MSEVQRARMLTAAIEVATEHGYGGMSVARVAHRAGVSRRTFYDLFEDREDCFLEAFDEIVIRATTIAYDTVISKGDTVWRERVRSGLSALLAFAENEPGPCSLVIVDALGAGPNVLVRRAQILDTLTQIVDEGRHERKKTTGRAKTSNSDTPPPLTAEGIVGAVLAVIHARLLEPDHPSLTGLLNPLMGIIVLPYLGQSAAAQELTRPLPSTPPAPEWPTGNPLGDLGMRVTYRTLRVLRAISEHPAASNRQIAETAGVNDQGQISKLLTRLQSRGLIANTAQGHSKGEPNAWTLTTKGQTIQHTTLSGSVG